MATVPVGIVDDPDALGPRRICWWANDRSAMSKKFLARRVNGDDLYELLEWWIRAWQG